jgi:hypothetical protein
LVQDTSVEFFIRDRDQEAGDIAIPATKVEFTASFDEFLVRWRRLGLHGIVHSRGDTRNIDYKNSSVILIALYLGAVPIICDEEAFRGVGEAEGILKVDGSEAQWDTALRRLKEEAFCSTMLRRLEDHCRKVFAPSFNERVLDEILAEFPPVNIITWGNRVRNAVHGAVIGDTNVAWMEAELNSRSFRLALKARKMLDSLRNIRSAVIHRLRSIDVVKSRG